MSKMPETHIVTTTYSAEKCTAVIDGNNTLTHVSFAIESIASYFFGCSVSRLECERSSIPVWPNVEKHRNCMLDFTALDEPGPMRLSKVASVGSAVRERLWPRNIPENACFHAEENRIRKNKLNVDINPRQAMFFEPEGDLPASCVLVGHEYKPETPLSEIAYGMSDMFTGLFALGVKKIKWQGSLTGSQVCFHYNFDNKKILEFLLSNNSDYDINRLVSTLE